MQGALGAIGEGLIELGCDAGDLLNPLRCGFGGDVANTAVMASQVGAETRLCARVGADTLGRRLLTFWEQVGIDLAAVHLDSSAPTGLYVNERCANGGHRFDYHRSGSAGSQLSSADVSETFLDGLACLHYTGVTLAISSSAAEAASTAAGAARAAGARISFAVNHRPALRPSVPALAAAARAADLVFVSLEDAEAVFATDQESAVVGTIGDGREVVVTAGGRGATVHWQGRACRLAAPEVLVVDAAGAGDALAGAYLAARMVGAEPPEALRQGVAAASLSCTAQGCALSYPEAAAIGNVAMSLS